MLLENLKRKLNFHGLGPRMKEILIFKLYGNLKKNLEFQRISQLQLMLLMLNQQFMMPHWLLHTTQQ